MNNEKPTGGINFFEGLTLVFICLKLSGDIDWSWWAVLAPILISAAIYFILGLITPNK